jgi:hypothetical protein
VPAIAPILPCSGRLCKGFHQPFILGKHDRLFKAYAQLAGIEVVPIA